MVLELDPRYPILWRSERTLQFGVDDPRVVLDEVGYAEELMIDALRIGTSATTVRMIGARAGARAEKVERVLAALDPVLRRRPLTPVEPPAVLVDGIGPTATALRTLLAAEGCAVIDGDAAARPAAVVLIAAFAIAPARAARWLTADVPHLAVVFGDEEVRVGPFVEPGVGPCLHCVDRRMVDVDPVWPQLAVQLLGRTAPTETPLAAGYLAATVADLVLRRVHSGDAGMRSSQRVHRDASGRFIEIAVTPHAECGCRSLAESATAPAGSSDRSPSATTTVAAVAAPA